MEYLKKYIAVSIHPKYFGFLNNTYPPLEEFFHVIINQGTFYLSEN